MCDQVDRSDALVGQIAARQHGVVSVAQLRQAGLDKHRVRHRVRSGHLYRVHRGVYAVGHFGFPTEGRWMAAVLACGDSAVLSHRSAACLWGMLDPKSGAVDVSIPSAPGRSRRAGIRLHRCQSLLPSLTTRRWNIPVTTPARTIADLRRAVADPRRAVSPAELRRAIRQAEVRGLDTGIDAPSERTQSELEHLFLALCRHHCLPMPEVNVRIGGLLVDFAWLERRLIVETDGYRFHRGRTAFENDRARDLRLRELDFDVVRLSYRQVLNRPGQVARVLQKALAQASPPQ